MSSIHRLATAGVLGVMGAVSGIACAGREPPLPSLPPTASAPDAGRCVPVTSCGSYTGACTLADERALRHCVDGACFDTIEIGNTTNLSPPEGTANLYRLCTHGYSPGVPPFDCALREGTCRRLARSFVDDH
jgi:hypothetical protein